MTEHNKVNLKLHNAVEVQHSNRVASDSFMVLTCQEALVYRRMVNRFKVLKSKNRSGSHQEKRQQMLMDF